MAKYTFVNDRGEAFGPVEIETLKQWCGEGRLRSNSRLVEAETGRPLMASDIPELLPLVSTPAQGAIKTTPDLVAGIVVIGLSLVTLGYGIDRISQGGGDSKAGAYLVLLGIVAATGLGGVGMTGGRQYGFLVGVVMFGLQLVSGVGTMALIGGAFGDVPFLLALSYVVSLAALLYCVLRLGGGYGDKPLPGWK